MRQLPHMCGQSPEAGGQDKGTGIGFHRRLLGLGSQAGIMAWKAQNCSHTPFPASESGWAARFSSSCGQSSLLRAPTSVITWYLTVKSKEGLWPWPEPLWFWEQKAAHHPCGPHNIPASSIPT